MKSRYIVGLLLSGLLFAVGPTAQAFAAPSVWTVTRVTNDAKNYWSPSVSGDRLAFVCADTAQVLTWRSGDSVPTQLTAGVDDHEDPRVSGDRIAWDSTDSGGNVRFFTFKVGDASPAELLPGSSTSFGAPQVSGDRVVWLGEDGQQTQQVFTWKFGDSAPTQLTNDIYDHLSAQVSGDRVAWVGYGGGNFQVFTKKVGVDTAPTQLSTDANDHGDVMVSGDRVVWDTDDGTNFHIFTWKAGDADPTLLTDTASDFSTPQLSGDLVVWVESDGADDQVFTEKVGVDAEPVQLTSDAGAHEDPQVSGDRVVWDRDASALGFPNQVFTEIVGVDTAPTLLVSGVKELGNPQVSGDRIAWWGSASSSDAQMFTAVPNYQIHYAAGVGGSISGNASQTVNYEGTGTAVTAVPSTGYHFVGWSDGSAGATRTDAVVKASATYTASFALDSFRLRYTAGTGGNLSGTASQTVTYGGSGTTVTAVPSSGYRFVGWSDGVATAGRADTGVTADIAVSAVFAVSAPDTHVLIYGAGPGGAVDGASPQTVAAGADGATVTAVPDTGHHFIAWSDGVATAARRDTDIQGDVVVTAVFAPDTHRLHYSAGAGGTVSGAASQTVDFGGSGSAVTAVPGSGYHFVAWNDGVTVAARTDTNVRADLTVAAAFARNPLATKVTITSNRTSVTHKRPVVLSGTISSTQPKNTHVVVYAKKPGSSTWVKLATRSTTSTHRWSYTYSPATKGTWYFQVRFAGTAKYAASTSSSRKVTVK